VLAVADLWIFQVGAFFMILRVFIGTLVVVGSSLAFGGRAFGLPSSMPCADALAEFNSWTVGEIREHVVDQQTLSFALRASAEVLQKGLQTLKVESPGNLSPHVRLRWQNAAGLNLLNHVYHRLRVISAFDSWVHGPKVLALIHLLTETIDNFESYGTQRQLFSVEVLQRQMEDLAVEVDRSIENNSRLRSIYDLERWRRLAEGFRGLAHYISAYPSWANPLEMDGFVRTAVRQFHELILKVEGDHSIHNDLRADILTNLGLLSWEDEYGLLAIFEDMRSTVRFTTSLVVSGLVAEATPDDQTPIDQTRYLAVLLNQMSSSITGGILPLLRLVHFKKHDLGSLPVGERLRYERFLEVIEPHQRLQADENIRSRSWPSVEEVEFDPGMVKDSYQSDTSEGDRSVYH
jgi:hypothetical protein